MILNKSKNSIVINAFILLFSPIMATMLFCTNAFINNVNTKIVITIFVAVASLVCFLLYNKYNNKKYKFIFVLLSLVVIIVFVYTMLNIYGVMEVFSSVSSFKEYILNSGAWGILVFILIQLLQIIFLPIPSMIITLTGVAIYGPVIASIIVSIGILLGSYLAFFIGKVFGSKVVGWLVGYDNAIKYSKIIQDKGWFFLTVAFLLPLFPDDVLCIIAGITTMNFKTFFIISTITRPISVIFMSFFGGGYIIPFSGWGLYVWPVILVVVIASVILVYKHQDKLENIIFKKLLKINK